jgi:hypothetical protein
MGDYLLNDGTFGDWKMHLEVPHLQESFFRHTIG